MMRRGENVTKFEKEKEGEAVSEGESRKAEGTG